MTEDEYDEWGKAMKVPTIRWVDGGVAGEGATVDYFAARESARKGEWPGLLKIAETHGFAVNDPLKDWWSCEPVNKVRGRYYKTHLGWWYMEVFSGDHVFWNDAAKRGFNAFDDLNVLVRMVNAVRTAVAHGFVMDHVDALDIESNKELFGAV